ncbi:MAG: GNAT family N-acetyltransferase, partial [Endomicrobiales bacterium]
VFDARYLQHRLQSNEILTIAMRRTALAEAGITDLKEHNRIFENLSAQGLTDAGEQLRVLQNLKEHHSVSEMERIIKTLQKVVSRIRGPDQTPLPEPTQMKIIQTILREDNAMLESMFRDLGLDIPTHLQEEGARSLLRIFGKWERQLSPESMDLIVHFITTPGIEDIIREVAGLLDKKYTGQEVGKLGELKQAKLLEDEGFEIVCFGLRTPDPAQTADIDIVARRSGSYYFIECKNQQTRENKFRYPPYARRINRIIAVLNKTDSERSSEKDKIIYRKYLEIFGAQGIHDIVTQPVRIMLSSTIESLSAKVGRDTIQKLLNQLGRVPYNSKSYRDLRSPRLFSWMAAVIHDRSLADSMLAWAHDSNLEIMTDLRRNPAAIDYTQTLFLSPYFNPYGSVEHYQFGGNTIANETAWLGREPSARDESNELPVSGLTPTPSGGFDDASAPGAGEVNATEVERYKTNLRSFDLNPINERFINSMELHFVKNKTFLMNRQGSHLFVNSLLVENSLVSLKKKPLRAELIFLLIHSQLSRQRSFDMSRENLEQRFVGEVTAGLNEMTTLVTHRPAKFGDKLSKALLSFVNSNESSRASLFEEMLLMADRKRDQSSDEQDFFTRDEIKEYAHMVQQFFGETFSSVELSDEMLNRIEVEYALRSFSSTRNPSALDRLSNSGVNVYKYVMRILLEGHGTEELFDDAVAFTWNQGFIDLEIYRELQEAYMNLSAQWSMDKKKGVRTALTNIRKDVMDPLARTEKAVTWEKRLSWVDEITVERLKELSRDSDKPLVVIDAGASDLSTTVDWFNYLSHVLSDQGQPVFPGLTVIGGDLTITVDRVETERGIGYFDHFSKKLLQFKFNPGGLEDEHFAPIVSEGNSGYTEEAERLKDELVNEYAAGHFTSLDLVNPEALLLSRVSQHFQIRQEDVFSPRYDDNTLAMVRLFNFFGQAGTHISPDEFRTIMTRWGKKLQTGGSVIFGDKFGDLNESSAHYVIYHKVTGSAGSTLVLDTMSPNEESVNQRYLDRTGLPLEISIDGNGPETGATPSTEAPSIRNGSETPNGPSAILPKNRVLAFEKRESGGSPMRVAWWVVKREALWRVVPGANAWFVGQHKSLGKMPWLGSFITVAVQYAGFFAALMFGSALIHNLVLTAISGYAAGAIISTLLQWVLDAIYLGRDKTIAPLPVPLFQRKVEVPADVYNNIELINCTRYQGATGAKNLAEDLASLKELYELIFGVTVGEERIKFYKSILENTYDRGSQKIYMFVYRNEEGKIVGCGFLDTHGEVSAGTLTAELTELAVLPHYQRAGIGKALWVKRMRVAEALRASSVSSYVIVPGAERIIEAFNNLGDYKGLPAFRVEKIMSGAPVFQLTPDYRDYQTRGFPTSEEAIANASGIGDLSINNNHPLTTAFIYRLMGKMAAKLNITLPDVSSQYSEQATEIKIIIEKIREAQSRPAPDDVKKTLADHVSAYLRFVAPLLGLALLGSIPIGAIVYSLRLIFAYRGWTLPVSAAIVLGVKVYSAIASGVINKNTAKNVRKTVVGLIKHMHELSGIHEVSLRQSLREIRGKMVKVLDAGATPEQMWANKSFGARLKTFIVSLMPIKGVIIIGLIVIIPIVYFAGPYIILIPQWQWVLPAVAIVPLVIEIYLRLTTGTIIQVTQSDMQRALDRLIARAQYLSKKHWWMSERVRHIHEEIKKGLLPYRENPGRFELGNYVMAFGGDNPRGVTHVPERKLFMSKDVIHLALGIQLLGVAKKSELLRYHILRRVIKGFDDFLLKNRITTSYYWPVPSLDIMGWDYTRGMWMLTTAAPYLSYFAFYYQLMNNFIVPLHYPFVGHKYQIRVVHVDGIGHWAGTVALRPLYTVGEILSVMKGKMDDGMIYSATQFAEEFYVLPEEAAAMLEALKDMGEVKSLVRGDGAVAYYRGEPVAHNDSEILSKAEETLREVIAEGAATRRDLLFPPQIQVMRSKEVQEITSIFNKRNRMIMLILPEGTADARLDDAVLKALIRGHFTTANSESSLLRYHHQMVVTGVNHEFSVQQLAGDMPISIEPEIDVIRRKDAIRQLYNRTSTVIENADENFLKTVKQAIITLDERNELTTEMTIRYLNFIIAGETNKAFPEKGSLVLRRDIGVDEAMRAIVLYVHINKHAEEHPLSILGRLPEINAGTPFYPEDEINVNGDGTVQFLPATGNEVIDLFLSQLFNRKKLLGNGKIDLFLNQLLRKLRGFGIPGYFLFSPFTDGVQLSGQELARTKSLYAEIRAKMLENVGSSRNMLTGIDTMYSVTMQNSLQSVKLLFDDIIKYPEYTVPSKIDPALHYLRVVGRGKFSVVILVKDGDQSKALKVPFITPGKSRDLFMLREKRILRDIGSAPGLVKISKEYDNALLLEYVQGSTLGTYVTKYHKVPPGIFEVIKQFINGVSAAGYRIDDLSVINIMIDTSNEVRFFDTATYYKASRKTEAYARKHNDRLFAQVEMYLSDLTGNNPQLLSSPFSLGGNRFRKMVRKISLGWNIIRSESDSYRRNNEVTTQNGKGPGFSAITTKNIAEAMHLSQRYSPKESAKWILRKEFLIRLLPPIFMMMHFKQGLNAVFGSLIVSSIPYAISGSLYTAMSYVPGLSQSLVIAVGVVGFVIGVWTAGKVQVRFDTRNIGETIKSLQSVVGDFLNICFTTSNEQATDSIIPSIVNVVIENQYGDTTTDNAVATISRMINDFQSNSIVFTKDQQVRRFLNALRTARTIDNRLVPTAYVGYGLHAVVLKVFDKTDKKYKALKVLDTGLTKQSIEEYSTLNILQSIPAIVPQDIPSVVRLDKKSSRKRYQGRAVLMEFVSGPSVRSNPGSAEVGVLTNTFFDILEQNALRIYDHTGFVVSEDVDALVENGQPRIFDVQFYTKMDNSSANRSLVAARVRNLQLYLFGHLLEREYNRKLAFLSDAPKVLEIFQARSVTIREAIAIYLFLEQCRKAYEKFSWFSSDHRGTALSPAFLVSEETSEGLDKAAHDVLKNKDVPIKVLWRKPGTTLSGESPQPMALKGVYALIDNKVLTMYVDAKDDGEFAQRTSEVISMLKGYSNVQGATQPMKILSSVGEVNLDNNKIIVFDYTRAGLHIPSWNAAPVSTVREDLPGWEPMTLEYNADLYASSPEKVVERRYSPELLTIQHFDESMVFPAEDLGAGEHVNQKATPKNIELLKNRGAKIYLKYNGTNKEEALVFIHTFKVNGIIFTNPAAGSLADEIAGMTFEEDVVIAAVNPLSERVRPYVTITLGASLPRNIKPGSIVHVQLSEEIPEEAISAIDQLSSSCILVFDRKEVMEKGVRDATGVMYYGARLFGLFHLTPLTDQEKREFQQREAEGLEPAMFEVSRTREQDVTNIMSRNFDAISKNRSVVNAIRLHVMSVSDRNLQDVYLETVVKRWRVWNELAKAGKLSGLEDKRLEKILAEMLT